MWWIPLPILAGGTLLLLLGAGRGKALSYSKRLQALVIGADNRWSTSKVTALAWTYALLYAAIALLIDGLADQFLTQALDGTYVALLGFPYGAAILAKAITVDKIASGEIAKPTADTISPNPFADIVS